MWVPLLQEHSSEFACVMPKATPMSPFKLCNGKRMGYLALQGPMAGLYYLAILLLLWFVCSLASSVVLPLSL
jgi:hypothetical protein